MKDENMQIIENRKVALGTYKMVLKVAEHIEKILPGQFLSIKLNNQKRLLRRPICISDVKGNEIEIYYQVVGEGTQELASYEAGQRVQVLYPLGNGFPILEKANKIMLIGGGLGCALFPLFARNNKGKEIYSFLGYASKEKIYLEEIDNTKTYISTENGAKGHKGFITNYADELYEKIKPDLVLCCGPEVMYKALLKTKHIDKSIVYVSLERRMGCGFGACLVCNCEIKVRNEINNLRACKDGPIFKLEDIVL